MEFKKLNITEPRPSMERDVNALRDQAVEAIESYHRDREQIEAKTHYSEIGREVELRYTESQARRALDQLAKDLRRYESEPPEQRRRIHNLSAPEPKPLHGEIRTVLRGMTDKARSAQLSDAMTKRDRTTLEAVIFAPPYLSGTTEEIQTALREDMIQAFYADDLAEVAALETALKRTQKTLATAYQALDKSEAAA